jgi:hypothetical protein
MTTTALDAVRSQAMDRSDSPQAESGIWDDASRRTTAAGKKLARELLGRLEVSSQDADALLKSESFDCVVTRWGIEFNAIEWYDRAIKTEQGWFTASRYISVAVGLLTVAGTVYLAIKHPNIGVAQFGVLVAGGLAVLQILAASGDPKARLGTFRKARADLKESLFTFVETWKGRVTEGSAPGKPQPSPDFVTALLQEVRTARKVARCERDEYFATFKSPGEIATAAGQALDVVRGRQGELAAARSAAAAPQVARETAMNNQIQDLRGKLNDARAQKEALEDRLKRLQALPAPADDAGKTAFKAKLADLQAKLDDAETDRFKAQALLDLAVKSDVAHAV